ncbi:secreted and transmembrane protein 1 isoform X2 [Eumetopias jubatus]|uniref:secreted and transmembrane protein 1 isoform X2 n=1 Tax=Eumetopias jubatus TaxID=34886 RepID=UPI001015E282|nr:secreted and transmembrane protein 1 isoform X2 [Eumetopias jubatus]
MKGGRKVTQRKCGDSSTSPHPRPSWDVAAPGLSPSGFLLPCPCFLSVVSGQHRARSKERVPRADEEDAGPLRPPVPLAMLTSTFPLSVPQMLRTILLTASLSAQNGRAGDLPCRAGCAHLAQNPGDGEAAAGLAETQQHSQWDNPICTEGVVSVSRGERAVMACNISNPFLSVAIYLSSHGKSFEPVFSMRPPGCFCQGGWRLQVQGSMAQLVIDDVNHTQAGCYRWYLQGLQRNIRVTTLNVSGTTPPTQFLSCGVAENGAPSLARPGEGTQRALCGLLVPWSHLTPGLTCIRGRVPRPEGPETPCPPKAGDQFRVAPVVISIIAGLIFLVVIVLSCTRGRVPLPSPGRKCSGPQTRCL